MKIAGDPELSITNTVVALQHTVNCLLNQSLDDTGGWGLII